MSVASALVWRSIALGVALLLPGEVAAQSHQGSMEAQSRAGIRISVSVSVMPRFSVSRNSSAPATAEPNAGTVRDALRIFSNTSGLRIHLVDPSKTAKADEAALFLIAPD